MRLSPHFTLGELTVSETAKRDKVSNDPPPEIIDRLRETAWRLEIVRTLLGNRPVRINSGFRTVKVNRLVGGSNTSDHLTGFAVDFVPTNMTIETAVKTLRNSALHYDQIIQYASYIHIGFGPRMRKQFIRK